MNQHLILTPDKELKFVADHNNHIIGAVHHGKRMSMYEIMEHPKVHHIYHRILERIKKEGYYEQTHH